MLIASVLVAVLAWLPFLHAPLTSDESGFLLLGQHLHHGTSLYGDYWVDRPPLLLWLFHLAAALSPAHTVAVGLVGPGVKMLGAAAAGLSVALGWVLVRVATPASRLSRIAAPVLMAALVCTPLLGMPETNGEVLALPFVLGGLACLVAVLRHPERRRATVLAAVAGASAAAAALVKQNVVDVFVFGLVALVVLGRRGPAPLRRRHTSTFAAGTIAALGAAVGVAAAQGTSPRALWYAVVTFRLHASAVIGSSATDTTTQRLGHLLRAAAESGAAPLLLTGVVALGVHAWRGRRSSPRTSPAADDLDLTWPVLALVTWESIGVAAGGSYWLHYLTGAIPGLLLVTCLTLARWRTQRVAAVLVAAGLAYASIASAVVWGGRVEAPVVVSEDAQVTTYLRDHAAPVDGVVVAFGHPDIVAGSGLASPYPELWSLPVRVDDPDLASFSRVLRGRSAPRWVVVSGSSLASWGLDATAAQRYLQAHYSQQATYGDWHIWQRGRVERRAAG